MNCELKACFFTKMYEAGTWSKDDDAFWYKKIICELKWFHFSFWYFFSIVQKGDVMKYFICFSSVNYQINWYDIGSVSKDRFSNCAMNSLHHEMTNH